jgi:hypothetical protein
MRRIVLWPAGRRRRSPDDEPLAAGSRPVAVFTNLDGCVFLALDPNSGFATGKGPDPESAKGEAWAKLPSSYWASDGPCSS